MKVLVTGGGGFIGSHLVAHQLRRGHHVRAFDRSVDRLSNLTDHPRLEIVVGDLTDKDTISRIVHGVDCIYHLASAHLEVNIPEARYWAVNVTAVERLLRAAQAAGVKRIVHCSSVGVFGDTGSQAADEATPCCPSNVYGRTKLAGEQLALQFAQQSGLPVTVARPSWVYGPGCPRTSKLFRTIKKRRFVMIGDGQALRHPIYIEDAMRGLERCAEVDGAAGGVFILAGDTPVTLAELIDTIADVIGVPHPSLRLPVAPAKAAGTVLQTLFTALGRQPPFSRRSIDFFTSNNAFATAKAQRELGFSAATQLHQGLTNTWHVLNQHKE